VQPVLTVTQTSDQIAHHHQCWQCKKLLQV